MERVFARSQGPKGFRLLSSGALLSSRGRANGANDAGATTGPTSLRFSSSGMKAAA
jgi:hypothetical protein